MTKKHYVPVKSPYDSRKGKMKTFGRKNMRQYLKNQLKKDDSLLCHGQDYADDTSKREIIYEIK